MEGRVKKFWAFISILLVAAAAMLCVFASWRGSLYIKPSGNPQLTVSSFFDSLKAGKYSQAYACLNDYVSLGLENEPDSEEARLIFDALKQSYDYKLVGKCEENLMDARQPVSFQYLDVKSVETAISKKIDVIISRLVSERSMNEIYDENDNYRPELTDEVYLIALQEVLASPEAYYKLAQFDVELSYVDGQWLMKTNPSLFNAITGGTN